MHSIATSVWARLPQTLTTNKNWSDKNWILFFVPVFKLLTWLWRGKIPTSTKTIILVFRGSIIVSLQWRIRPYYFALELLLARFSWFLLDLRRRCNTYIRILCTIPLLERKKEKKQIQIQERKLCLPKGTILLVICDLMFTCIVIILLSAILYVTSVWCCAFTGRITGNMLLSLCLMNFLNLYINCCHNVWETATMNFKK